MAEAELVIPRALLEERFAGSSLAARLHETGRTRKGLFTITDAFRLHDVQADAVCRATIECFRGFAVINAYGADESECEQLSSALAELGCMGTYVKYRARADLRRTSRDKSAPRLPIRGRAAPNELQVTENGLALQVRLDDGISTGIFLDQRDSRSLLRQHCAGGRVLNLFCYTGAFSVAAAAGRAASVTSIDSSATALRRLDANIGLNSQEKATHRLLKADALEWLGRALRRGERYDWIVLDPPSFSSRGKETFSVARQYRELAEACIGLLAPGGRLLAVTNHRQTSCDAFERLLSEAGATVNKSCALSWVPAPRDCAPRDRDVATKSVLVTAS
ncbi:MAG: hypothetical protein RJA70_1960 [Pseudomonadota bacterium]